MENFSPDREETPQYFQQGDKVLLMPSQDGNITVSAIKFDKANGKVFYDLKVSVNQLAGEGGDNAPLVYIIRDVDSRLVASPYPQSS